MIASVFKNTGLGYRMKQSDVTRFYLLKKAETVLDAKNNNFHFLRF